MNNDIDKIRELIGENNTDLALKQFIVLAKDSDLKNQLTILAARLKDMRIREIKNTIYSSEAFIIYAQINSGLLDLLNEYENGESSSRDLKNKKSVFISYNHEDSAIATIIKEKLTVHDIDVVIDSEKMLAGEDIRSFIEKCIRETDVTISIISKKSLLSAWVAMESINTFYHEKTDRNKKFIACYIEDDFFKRNFTDDALNVIDTELLEIETIIKARADKGRNIRDISNEYTRLKELKNGMDEIVRHLRESLCIDIRNENLEKNFLKIVQAVQL